MVGERDMISFRGDDALLSTTFLASGRVMNLTAKSLGLGFSVDSSMALSIVCMLCANAAAVTKGRSVRTGLPTILVTLALQK